MSFFDVFGKNAVFPDPADVVLGVDFGETNELTGTLTNSGSGSETVVITVEYSDDPVENATVYLTSDLAGSTQVTPYVLTNSSGIATLLVDPGTYYLWVTKETVSFDNIPQEITVVDV